MADNNNGYIDSQTPQGYASIRQQEQAGTGFASNQATPWPAQQAAARADQAHRARINWTPPIAKKRGR